MIKRFHTLALVAVLGLVGCIANPDEYDPDYVISFTPAVTTIDGDVPGDGSVYPESSTFGVWAFMLGQGQSWSEYGPKASTWLDNATVNFSGDSWKTSDVKHWGATGEQLTFFAYSPKTLDVKYDNTWGLTYSGYNTLTDDVDFLYADAQADLEKNAVTGVVAIPFKHAISKVEVRAKESESGYDIVLKSLKIGDVYYKGDFHSQPVGWNLTSDTTDLEFCTKETTLTTKETSFGTFNVLAQAQTRPVTILFDIAVNGHVTDRDVTVDIKPITGKWLPGRKYVYTLDITSDVVTYKTDVLD